MKTRYARRLHKEIEFPDIKIAYTCTRAYRRISLETSRLDFPAWNYTRRLT